MFGEHCSRSSRQSPRDFVGIVPKSIGGALSRIRVDSRRTGDSRYWLERRVFARVSRATELVGVAPHRDFEPGTQTELAIIPWVVVEVLVIDPEEPADFGWIRVERLIG